MTLEEREAALAIGAYDKRSHYQLRDDPVSLLREQLLRDRPVYTAQSLARYEEANHAKRMQAIQQYVQPQPPQPSKPLSGHSASLNQMSLNQANIDYTALCKEQTVLTIEEGSIRARIVAAKAAHKDIINRITSVRERKSISTQILQK